MKAFAVAARGALESQADEAYRVIEEQIITLALAPGSVVTEKTLSDLTGLGRTPVREALVRLKQDHLITVLPRQGILIRPIEPEYSLMAVELRHLVERLIVKQACALATPLERSRLRRLADRIEDAAKRRDVLEFMRRDHEFNVFVAAVARNPIAARTVAPLHAMLRRLGYYFARDTGYGLERTGPAHARLIRMIAEGEPESAVRALEGLLELTREIAGLIARETSETAVGGRRS